MQKNVIGPFFFPECTISATVYLDMKELYAAHQLEEFQLWVGSPTGWSTATLGVTFTSVLGCNISKPMDWEGRSNTKATTFTGLYPSGLFLFGYVKDKMYSTPVPDIGTLKAMTRDALAAVTEEMLEKI
jgi:hypothetical protein